MQILSSCKVCVMERVVSWFKVRSLQLSKLSIDAITLGVQKQYIITSLLVLVHTVSDQTS